MKCMTNIIIKFTNHNKFKKKHKKIHNFINMKKKRNKNNKVMVKKIMDYIIIKSMKL